jgi:hypothetical protein
VLSKFIPLRLQSDVSSAFQVFELLPYTHTAKFQYLSDYRVVALHQNFAMHLAQAEGPSREHVQHEKRLYFVFAAGIFFCI